MAGKNKFYITTAIDYVNAEPHIGHAFEKTLADAIARWKRIEGRDVYFLTGVDENAQKNFQAAEKAGIPVKKFIDKNSSLFLELCRKLNISYSNFIRTTDKSHCDAVQEIVRDIIKKGEVYKGVYEGYYCVGCEAFITEKDLVNGKCPEHKKEPEFRKEDAFFFKLSRYQEKLLEIIPDYVIPKEKAHEVINRVKEGLQDLCISRKNANIGVDFPDEKEFKVYVWIDALINYISGSAGNWPADLHVIGKGINWFHAVVWPAILLSAGYKLPKKLLVHGYITSAGQKMSKSIGNVVNPLTLLEKYSADTVRYSLLRCSVFEDSDFSEEILIERHNSELADKLGNLVSRVAALAEKYGIEKAENKLVGKLKIKEIEKCIASYELDKALSLIFEFIGLCNEYVQENKIWETHDAKKLYELADSIKAIAILLYPFIPESCEKIAEQFGFKIENLSQVEKPLKEVKIRKGEILFKKIN
ncbi:MAG: methionine--tRNA ligase [archaeon]